MQLLQHVAFPIDRITGVLWVIVVPLLFVGSLYVWPTSTRVSRNASGEILRRFLSVGTVCTLMPFLLYALGTPCTSSQPGCASVWAWMGLADIEIYSMSIPIIATVLLFLGPLIQGIDENQDSWLMCTRNYVIGPIFEEWAFRAILIPPLLSLLSPWQAVLLLPWVFGIAHLHHVIQRTKLMGMEDGQAILASLVQLCYTSLFGTYSTYLFVWTNNLYTPIIVHAICNYFGVPDIEGLINSIKKGEWKVPLGYVVGLISFVMLIVHV